MKERNAERRPPSSWLRKGFVSLPENRSAIHAIRRLAISVIRSKPGPAFPLLLLHGLPGTGKSHLINMLLERVIDRRPDATARIIPARDLGRILIEPTHDGSSPIQEFRDCDLLIVEDVQHLPPQAVAAFTGLVDHRNSRRKTIVVTAGSGPAMMTHLPTRLTSRLAGGLVVGLLPLSSVGRQELARRLCEKHHIQVTPDVIDWLARKTSGSVRSIVGDIARLKELARTVAPPLTRNAIIAAGLGEEDALTIDLLVDRVADHFGISVKQMKQRDRLRRYLWPRQVGMYLARRLTKLSLPGIGRCFGGYDHTTVMHACRKVEDRLQFDIGLPRELEELASQLA
ncbi:MAG: hypothetical protein K8T89_13105 [Planctomycetes bacterium]|nr:hypothetical protein [Planctomycetota bacterium]